MSPSIFQALLGQAFTSLPEELQVFHGTRGVRRFEGRYSAQAADTLFGRGVARLLALPSAASDQPFAFELDASDVQEIWQRHFADRAMRSRMHMKSGQLLEQLGPLRFHFTLATEGLELVMQLQTVTVLGLLKCPRWLFPAIVARESASPGRLHFRVEARLPGLGRLAAYRGHLVTGDQSP